MCIFHLTLESLAKLEPAENVTDVTLRWWSGSCLKEVLPVVKGWRHLNRLTFMDLVERKSSFPPFEVLSDFIMGMKHVSYLHIVPQYLHSDDQWKILRDKVNELILPLRPNFIFNVSFIYQEIMNMKELIVVRNQV